MSFQRISPRPLQEPNPSPLDNQLAIANEQQNALALQEARNLALLGQALEIINEKDKVLEEEHAKNHQQDQETILSLQKALQALIQQNSQLTQENIILKSQNDQMNTAHEADTKAAQERFKTLEDTLLSTRFENDGLKKDITRLKIRVEIHEESFSIIKYTVITPTPYPRNITNVLNNLLNITEAKLQEQKKKEKEEDETGKCCIQ